MNALTKIENTALAAMSEAELVSVLQTSLYPNAKLESIKMVLGYCKAAGLDPMQKPVHIVPMDVKVGNAYQKIDVVMPGIGLYRTQAARTGAYAGVSEPEFGPVKTKRVQRKQFNNAHPDDKTFKMVDDGEMEYPEWCKVTVRRLLGGQTVEFTAVEYWLENYATAGKDSSAPNAMWKKRPYGQIAKCAEAQALRKAFPEVGSQPTADEMEGKEFTTIDAGTGEVITPKRTEPPPPPPPPAQPVWPDDKFAEHFVRWGKAVAAGLKTVDEIITLALTKGALTKEQEAKIRALPKAPQAADDIVMTYAQVADRLNKADDADKLAVAGSLIQTVADEQQRKELTALYDKRAAELNPA